MIVMTYRRYDCGGMTMFNDDILSLYPVLPRIALNAPLRASALLRQHRLANKITRKRSTKNKTSLANAARIRAHRNNMLPARLAALWLCIPSSINNNRLQQLHHSIGALYNIFNSRSYSTIIYHVVAL